MNPFRLLLTRMGQLRRGLKALATLDSNLDQMLVNQGRVLAEQNHGKSSTNLSDFEFRVFSQWGEDGIVQKLTQAISIENKTFIEFGVGDFFESNCRFLMMKDNWSGFVMDCSRRNMDRLKAADFFWRYSLKAVDAFVTSDNINALLRTSNFNPAVGILSIDLDGNDYWIYKAVEEIRPSILILEYNSLFGCEKAVTVPYDSEFQRSKKHYSHLYWGASLPALASLASARGLVLVGTNSAGNNAFFVRKELMTDKLRSLTAEEAFMPSKIRESRDGAGRLSFLGRDEAIALLKGMPVWNTQTATMEWL